MRSLGGLLLVAGTLCAGTIATRIDRILASSPAAQQASWGIRIVDLRTGRAIYEKNENQFFIPASNTKLFSTALALTRLGPDHRFRTTITAPSAPDASGRVTGLRLVGGGDPNLSGRVLPYEYNSKPLNPFRHIEQFAEQLVNNGLKFVDGDIVGDDSAYAFEPYPDAWALDDPIFEYGAPVGALVLNDGSFLLRITPTTRGQPANVETSPPIPGLVIQNRVLTGDSTKITLDRLPGAPELKVGGSVAAPYGERLAVDDQALFAASVLREELLNRGVRVSGTARADHSPAPGHVLLTYESQPLILDLEVINKESQNLHAEIALLEVARAKTGTGSREAGLAELKSFLKEIGIPDGQYNFKDGSGLSRQTLVTPMTITKLLAYMYNSPHRDAWIRTLPIGGQDGTLANRFSGAKAAAEIHAKTGSITHVNALSGYCGPYAFSILVNNTNLPAGPVRRVMDQIALTLATPETVSDSRQGASQKRDKRTDRRAAK